ncbi:MAG TPA: hypothetical protein VLI93_10585, partial [Acetobacteraceae bacterium]|nr:hypothetical protein [Acetobacteraceae bacterium]
MDYYGLRYIDGQAFESEIRRLRIYRGFVGDSRLEELERCRVVIPKWRIQYPDPIARRFWVEQHPNMDLLSGDVEPDGPRLSNAIEFTNALFRWQYRRVYGRCTHPLDAADPRFAEFAHQPATRPFLPWGSFRLDVSNTDHAPLYHSGAVTVLYTSWQVLLVAEAADM